MGNSGEVEEENMNIKETVEGIKKRVPSLKGPGEVSKHFMKTHSHPEMVVEPEASPPGQTPSFLGTDAEHFIMSTPPRPDRDEGRPRSPPGLGAREYPILVSTVPTRHEEKAIAKIIMMAVFGQ